MRRFVTIVLVLLALAGCNLNAEIESTPIPTPTIPQVQFIAPQEGDRVLEGFNLTIDVVGSDETPGAGIARIEIYLNGELLREVTPIDAIAVEVFRAETNWFAEGLGLHALSAIAYRNDGTRSDEALINVEVVNE